MATYWGEICLCHLCSFASVHQSIQKRNKLLATCTLLEFFNISHLNQGLCWFFEFVFLKIKSSFLRSFFNHFM